MSAIAVVVTGISSPDPHDAIALDFTVMVDGVSSGWSGSVYVAFDATANDINAAIRTEAAAVAATHSVFVASSDVRRVFGGAMETVVR